jgi:uncharacterized protein YggE
MKRKISLIITGIIAVVMLAACAPAAASNSETVRSLSVSGIGQVHLVPDIATINIGVRTEAEKVSDAMDENTAQANAISQVLQNMGVLEKDIQTSNFNVYPVDRYNDMSGQIEGTYFIVENTVTITVRDLASLGDVLNAVVEAGANTIYGISFDVDDREAAAKQAQELAIQNAYAEAESIAETAGVELGELLNINVSSGAVYTVAYDTKAGGYEDSSVPIAAGMITITMSCSASFAIH